MDYGPSNGICRLRGRLGVYPLLKEAYMKTLTLALTILTFSFIAADQSPAASPSRFGVELVSMPMSSTGLSSAAAHFAQVGVTSQAPNSSGLVLTLLAVSVLVLRLVGLNRARALADHERDSYQGKAQMFRSLHEERSDRK